MDTPHKIVDGVEVPLLQEEAEQMAAWSGLGGLNAAIDAQVSALEALQTPRLVREAVSGVTQPIVRPGSPLDGMTPFQALRHLDEQIAALRAQRVAG